jgi:hypothetical protein
MQHPKNWPDQHAPEGGQWMKEYGNWDYCINRGFADPRYGKEKTPRRTTRHKNRKAELPGQEFKEPFAKDWRPIGWTDEHEIHWQKKLSVRDSSARSTSMGAKPAYFHAFGADLGCLECGKTWEEQDADPTLCANGFLVALKLRQRTKEKPWAEQDLEWHKKRHR